MLRIAAMTNAGMFWQHNGKTYILATVRFISWVEVLLKVHIISVEFDSIVVFFSLSTLLS